MHIKIINIKDAFKFLLENSKNNFFKDLWAQLILRIIVKS